MIIDNIYIEMIINNPKQFLAVIDSYTQFFEFDLFFVPVILGNVEADVAVEQPYHTKEITRIKNENDQFQRFQKIFGDNKLVYVDVIDKRFFIDLRSLFKLRFTNMI